MTNTPSLKGMFWLGSAGVSLVIGGIITILAANWSSIPFFVQILLALTPLACSLGGAYWYHKRSAPSRLDIEEVLGDAWAGSVLCAVALLARVLQLSSDSIAFCITMYLLLSAVTLRLRSLAALLMQFGFLIATVICVNDTYPLPTTPFLLPFLLFAWPLMLPRILEIHHSNDMRGAWGRYFIAICTLIYAHLVLFYCFERYDFLSSRHHLLLHFLLAGCMFIFALWGKRDDLLRRHPLTSLSLILFGIMGIACLFEPSSCWWLGLIVLVPLLVAYRWSLHSEGILLFTFPLIQLSHLLGPLSDVGIIAGFSIILTIGLLRNSRLIANFSLVMLLGIAFSLMAEYEASLMKLGIIFVIFGILLLLLNLFFARISQTIRTRFPTLQAPVYLPKLPTLSDDIHSRLRLLCAVIILLCCGAQALVPGWLLLKRHLILTQGERIELTVTSYDPRDLFAGKYIRLQCNNLPDQLENVPKNYLRYYCDERDAQHYERELRKRNMTLVVRLWRGSALAEALLVDNIPAHLYIQQIDSSYVTSPTSVGLNLQVAATVTLGGLLTKQTIDFFEAPFHQGERFIPCFVNFYPLWNTFLKKMNIARTPADLPHPIWWDRWLSGEALPPEAFEPLVPMEQNRYDTPYFDAATYCHPVFMGLPSSLAATPHTYAELAAGYYAILKDKVWRSTRSDEKAKPIYKAVYLPRPPKDQAEAKDIFTALDLNLHYDRCLIFADRIPLPEGFPWDLHTDKLIVVTSSAPQKDIPWIQALPQDAPLKDPQVSTTDTSHAPIGWMWTADPADLDVAFVGLYQQITPNSIAKLREALQKTNGFNPKNQKPETICKDLLIARTELLSRRETSPLPTDANDLQQLEAWLTQHLCATIFQEARSLDDYRQWHLRSFGTIPEVKDLPIHKDILCNLPAETVQAILTRALSTVDCAQ